MFADRNNIQLQILKVFIEKSGSDPNNDTPERRRLEQQFVKDFGKTFSDTWEKYESRVKLQEKKQYEQL